MSNPDADRGPLDVWYRRRIGDPSTDDEGVGYWLFVAGLGFALGGVVLLVASATLASGAGAGTREGGYALGALGLALLLDGFVVGRPLGRQAARVAHAGAGLCVLAVAWFGLAALDGGQFGGAGRVAVGLYALGLVAVGVGGVLVPLLTGTASDSRPRTSAPVPPTFGGADETRADAAGAEAGAGGGGDLDPDLGEREAYLAELAATTARFELYEDADGWRWRLRHVDGHVLAASGRRYASRRRAQRGLNDVRRNAGSAPLLQVDSASAEPVAGEGEPGHDGADDDAAEGAATFAPLDGEGGRATFEVSRDGADRWRWRLVDADGAVLATSGQGYASERRARRGLAGVRRAVAPANYLRVDPAAFEVYRDGDGRWRWRLVHRDGAVLAESGQGYDSRRDAHAAADRRADGLDDAAVEVTEDWSGEYRWRLVDGGTVLAASPAGYGSGREADDAVERVREHAPRADVLAVGDAAFETYRAEPGEWRWRLRHRQGSVLAASARGYDSPAGAREAVDGVKRAGPAAEVVDA